MASSLTSEPAQRRRDPSDKRERLLSAAKELFISPGFAKTTTKQIAKASGVSEGILFHQFGSKVGLLKELVHVYAQGAVDEFTRGGLAELNADNVVRRLIAFIDQDREAFTLILDHSVLLKENGLPTLAELIVPEIEKSIRTATSTKRELPADPAIMAEFQFSLVEAAYRGWLKSDTEKEKEAFIQEGVRSMRALL